METQLQVPEDSEPCLIQEVLAALKKESIAPRLEAKNWGDWIHIDGSQTVISIESNHGLTRSATLEHAEDERNDPAPAILRAFGRMGWVGIDEDGEYPLG